MVVTRKVAGWAGGLCSVVLGLAVSAAAVVSQSPETRHRAGCWDGCHPGWRGRRRDRCTAFQHGRACRVGGCPARSRAALATHRVGQPAGGRYHQLHQSAGCRPGQNQESLG